MLTLLLILFVTWLLMKLGIGLFKIFAFLLICAVLFFCFIHLLIPILIIIAAITIFWALIRF